MEITQNTVSTNPQVGTGQIDAGTQISSDFEVFLQMLTAQMKYQDPLNPVDSTDYATQLATFSGVEQAVLTNDLLKDLTGQMAVGGLTDLASWVGREARSSAPVKFEGEPITLYPQSIGAADSFEIIVRDADNLEIQRMTYTPSSDGIVWAGVLADGSPVQEGVYSFQVVGRSNDEIISDAGVETYGKVTEVRIENGQTVVVLRGGVEVPSVDVTALRDGQFAV